MDAIVKHWLYLLEVNCFCKKDFLFLLLEVRQKFIADVHLGKLAKVLRLLGFDTTYENSLTNSELIRIALMENRLLLSRNSGLGKKELLKFCYIKDKNPDQQLKQVVHEFQLKDKVQPFTRCIVCNGILEAISKESISNQVQKNTLLYFNDSWQCNSCTRVYWKGSHYDRMLKMVKRILN